ncbi:pre-mRNA-processing factor 39-like [Ananas comosus]|uniref:Pre-mRNA-processing factor 39-like n=1 Tax=Ananas comosus TaxID=4615 RepID=A0A6P5FF71_ANACO|nr:pre-mRNA-processing factor 39-like [Ananas comosus]
MEEDAVLCDGAREEPPMANLDFFEHKLQALLEGTPSNFEDWTSLIREVEKTSPNDIGVISMVYDAFLSEFPLCYGYWKKYAIHKARLCSHKEMVEVFERAVLVATYSVDLWVSYCSYAMLLYEDPADIRRLFERGLHFVGKNYLCHLLWDKYIEFEYSQKQWSYLANIYINTLRFPTKKLHSYHERFKKLVALLEEEVANRNTKGPEKVLSSGEDKNEKDGELADKSTEIRDLMNRLEDLPGLDALKKYISAGEQLYKKSSQMDRDISCFEARIRRHYFHVKPLDEIQLQNWHQYLDFSEMQGDFDWTVKLYERCLIPCASYPEFWIRYVEFVDARGGREIANYTLGRALSFFLKRVPTFRMYCAMFKEQIGDFPGARTLFLDSGADRASDLLANVNREANMEKRMGNAEAAYKIYEKAIEMAKEKQSLQVISALYANFAQFTFVATGSIDAASEVFWKGIRQSPCKTIIKGLIQFIGTQGGAEQLPKLDSIIANALTPGSDVSHVLSSDDREDISLSFLEFVDRFGSIQEIRKAWARHTKLFPHVVR